ncbi:hypothetical protein J2X65_002861 [Ancylobacter sp. 3268]|uniref:SH3-like domain-containing protein n=1 Tax=Ancylobacter sp. 3268 TaxID=2817752 RepID=UPI002861B01B|nr:SH3-like domain-containing protein [Ancylobacter sp. 3268]MDR6953500.1 hypothetical protein [Ancylobacter sp. 3268]
MNSVHDCGGFDGFGRVVPEGYDGREPVFKEEWERRMCGLFMITIGAHYSDDEFRQSRERLEPVKYLTRPYYEQWWFAVARLMMEKGLLTPEDFARHLAAGRAAAGSADILAGDA